MKTYDFVVIWLMLLAVFFFTSRGQYEIKKDIKDSKIINRTYYEYNVYRFENGNIDTIPVDTIYYPNSLKITVK